MVLLSAFMAVLNLILNALHPYPILVPILSAYALLGSLSIFYFILIKRYVKYAGYGFMLGAVPVIVCFWFQKNGVYGSTPALILFACCTSILLCHQRKRLVVIFYSLLFILLLAIQLLYPSLVIDYPNKHIYLYSLIIVYVNVGVSAALLTALLLDTHNKDLQHREKSMKFYRSQVQNNKMAVEQMKSSLEEKEQLISMISHDSRAPISNLRKMLEFMNHGDISPEEFKSMIPKIDLQLANTKGLLDNVLMWMKEQSGIVEAKIEAIKFIDLLHSVKDLHLQSITDKNLLIKEQGNTEDIFHSDQNMVSTILRNLVHNAIKFSPDNGTIRIRWGHNSNGFSFSVIDSGKGMNKEQSQALEKRYFEDNSLIKSKDRGTGFGLKITYRFLDKMGGRMAIASAPGKGTDFTVFLPQPQ